MDLAAQYVAALDGVLHRAYLMAPDDLPRVVADGAGKLGASAAVLYLIDHEQQVLTPVLSGLTEIREVLNVEGTVAGRAFRLIEVQDVEAGDEQRPLRRLWLPLVDGVERLGVVEYVVEGAPLTAEHLRAFRQLAHLAAELLLSNSKYSDVFHWTRRRQPMALPAEMQYALLPPLTFGTDRVIISGLLAPAYEVGGDAFDYALNGNVAHVAIFDAVGHGLHASLLTTLAVSAYRNSRRAGLPLLETAHVIDTTLLEGFGPERYVTALLGQLDVETGRYSWLNAGHPDPMLLRDGRLVKELSCQPGLPLGMGDLAGPNGPQYVVCEEQLQPGDLLLLLTDGVDEARAEDGSFFGRDRLAEFAARELASGLPTPEVMRRLQAAILRHQVGKLQDDATTLFVEWLPPQPQAIVP